MNSTSYVYVNLKWQMFRDDKKKSQLLECIESFYGPSSNVSQHYAAPPIELSCNNIDTHFLDRIFK